MIFDSHDWIERRAMSVINYIRQSQLENSLIVNVSASRAADKDKYE